MDALVAKHLPGLRAFIRLRAGKLIRAKESCSDLVQSTCRDILTHVDRFQHPSEAAFRHWLYTTALRKIRKRADYYAAQRRDAADEVPIGFGSNEVRASALLARVLSICHATGSAPSGSRQRSR